MERNRYLQFMFEAENDEPSAAYIVVLAEPLDLDRINQLEDSISSYIEAVEEVDGLQLIRDVLSSDGISYVILEPIYTFHI